MFVKVILPPPFSFQRFFKKKKRKEKKRKLTLFFLSFSCRSLFSAMWSEDGVWYKARIDAILQNGLYFVFFLEYGNTDTVPITSLRALPTPPPPQWKVGDLCEGTRITPRSPYIICNLDLRHLGKTQTKISKQSQMKSDHNAINNKS